MAEKQWCPGCSREVEGVCHHFNCAIGPNGLDAQSRSSAGTEQPATREYVLRAMARNYKPGNSWDHLDAEACIQAANEIKALRDRIAALEARGALAPAQAASTPARDRILEAIADLQGEHEVMAGPFDPTKWKIEVSVADLQAVLAAQPPAAPVERSAPAAPTGDTRSGERPPASAAMGHRAGADTRCSAENEPVAYQMRETGGEWLDPFPARDIDATRRRYAVPLEGGAVELRALYAGQPQGAREPSAGSGAQRCPHDMGFDSELGPVGCRLVGLELECVCDGLHVQPQTVPDREKVARAIHDGLGGDGWAYTNYGGDEWNDKRADLLNAADAVLALMPSQPQNAKSGLANRATDKPSTEVIGPFNGEMPSSLNDACRRLDLAQERIAQLEALVEPKAPVIRCPCGLREMGSCPSCRKPPQQSQQVKAPDGYTKLPAGLICKCFKMWRDGNGEHWCCTPPLSRPNQRGGE
jgi:hypothetical protein